MPKKSKKRKLVRINAQKAYDLLCIVISLLDHIMKEVNSRFSELEIKPKKKRKAVVKK